MYASIISGSGALTSGSSTYKTGFGQQATSGFGMNSAMTDTASFGSQSKFGSSFGAESSFNSKFGSQFGSSFGAGASTASSSSGLSNYMQEAERLAKMQVQGMNVGGTRTGGSQYGSGFDNGVIGGIGGFGGTAALTAGAGGAGGAAGYKTKSWEKASKWSSQSEVTHPFTNI